MFYILHRRQGRGGEKLAVARQMLEELCSFLRLQVRNLALVEPLMVGVGNGVDIALTVLGDSR